MCVPEKLLEGLGVGEEVMTGKEVVSTALAGSEDLRETGIKPHTTMGEWLSRGWSICFFFNNFFFKCVQ